MNIAEVYDKTNTRLNELYRQKYKGLITYIEFANEQAMILLEFSNSIKKYTYQQIIEDIEEKQLLKIESELC